VEEESDFWRDAGAIAGRAVVLFLLFLGLYYTRENDVRLPWDQPRSPAYAARAQTYAPPQDAPAYQTYAPAPESRFTYDPTSGNSYRSYTDSAGRTTVYGHNARTGSTWTNYIEPNGRQHGFDADGNAWTYSNGIYTNTDGTICVGEEPYRNCN
jgi:hypothetical protein